MTGPTQITILLAGVSIALLAVLTAVWIRNYRTYGTGLLLGLIAFGGVLLLENALAIYFFFTMRMLYSSAPAVQQSVLVLRALQVVALAFLTWVTVK